MTYKITITKTETVRKLQPKRWTKIGQEMKEGTHYSDNKPYLSDTMGYTPEVETIETEETQVYEQTVDTLDLTKVIKAINSIE